MVLAHRLYLWQHIEQVQWEQVGYSRGGRVERKRNFLVVGLHFPGKAWAEELGDYRLERKRQRHEVF